MNMNSISGVVCLIACLVGSAWASPHPAFGESKLMQAMRSTSDLQQSNPSRSLECFQYYSDVFDQLLQQYQLDYANCQNASKKQTADVNEKYQQVVITLNDTAAATCELLIDCNQQADSLQALSCYSDVAAGNVRSMYNISSTASDYYANIQMDMQMIQFTENQCINNSQRTYELNTDQAYIKLQNCLMGIESVPTTSPSTTATSIASTVTSTTLATTTTSIPISTVTSTIAPTTTVSTRRTRRPTTSTTASFSTTNSAGSGSQNSLSNDLKKWLESLRH